MDAAAEDIVAALNTLPDDMLLQIIVACSDGYINEVPELDAVSGLGSLCKDVLQQLQRLRPIVCVQIRSLTAAQRQADGPCWRVVLLYTGEMTEAVVEEAVRGRVLSINMSRTKLVQGRGFLLPEVARRVVPELLGAGCSLLELNLDGVRLNSTWEATFGVAAVCSDVLHELKMDICGLQGPMPEMRLPALQALFLFHNRLTGGLEPLAGCTALIEIDLSHNQRAVSSLSQASGLYRSLPTSR